MIAFRCPHCGGDISYDPSEGKIVCAYCDSVLTLDEVNNSLKDKSTYLTHLLECTQCGAKIYATDTTTATFCSFCGSSVVLSERLVEEKKPDYIIPFKVSKAKAVKSYKEKIRKTLLAPDWLTEEGNVEKFRGIYMPFTLFSYKYHGKYTGPGTMSFVDRRGRTDYDVYREYELQDAPVTVDYNFLPVDGSSAFPDSMSRAVLPYTNRKLIPFDYPYYAGFYADSADVDMHIYEDKYRSLVERDISERRNLSSAGISVDPVNILKDIKLEQQTESASFPVWFLSIRNKKRISYAAVNGETGEIAADIPIDFVKFLRFALILAGLFSIVFNLLFTLTPGKLMAIASVTAFAQLLMAGELINDTYRRSRHLDDAGYSGVDQDKIVVNKSALKSRSTLNIALRFIFRFIVGTFIWILSVGLLIVLDIESSFIIGVVPFALMIWFIAAGVFNYRGYRIKKKNAPFLYKLAVQIKPIAAIVVNLYMKAVYPNQDEILYAAVLFGILMIILTSLDVIRMQNRFTMRDLPLFTEKRGGDR
ncbi:MAG: hypothetical protein IJ091_04475 [Oscillospiraceae bacterium]|nr:hypothetical protein [Oscillospiraceae bacterium]